MQFMFLLGGAGTCLAWSWVAVVARLRFAVKGRESVQGSQ